MMKQTECPNARTEPSGLRDPEGREHDGRARRGRHRVLALVLLLVVIAVPGIALCEEAAEPAGIAAPAPASSLVVTWAPWVVGLLLSFGVLDWLRNKLKESKLVQKLHGEHLVDVIADRLVAWAEGYAKKEPGGLSGESKYGLVKAKLRDKLAGGGTPIADDELESVIEAAHARANFPHAATSTSD